MADEKDVGGRPTKYLEKYNEQARKLCLLGCNDKEMADFFDVTLSTLNLWKIKYPNFSESLYQGKEGADIEVAQSLYHKTKTQKVTYKKPMVVSMGAGMGSEIQTVDCEQVIPADVGAIKMWLGNRHPDKWKNQNNIELSGKIETSVKNIDYSNLTEEEAKKLFHEKNDEL